MSDRLRVLASAYACNPFKGSEEGVGWGWVKAISENHDLWVITAEYHRNDIEKAISEKPELSERMRFFFVKQKPWHYTPTPGWKFIEGSILKPIMNSSYRLWQRDAYSLMLDLHKKYYFDLTHQLTYVGFRFPGQLWKLDIPFVWGPIGGLENTPWRFLPELGFSGSVYYAGRNIINSLHKRFLLGPKHAFRKAHGGIISSTEGIRKEILHWYGEESTVICETGPPQEIASDHSLRAPGEPLKLSWSGQHVPGKALPILFRALAELPAGIDWHLDILGEGPCIAKWKKSAKKLKIERTCIWHGQLSRTEALAVVRQSHVFVITSLKDLTSSVLLESLSLGVPVVCPDHCGFSNVITESCGLKIPVIKPKQFQKDMAAAIQYLYDTEERRRILAKGALTRIHDFSWEQKAKQVDYIYRNKLKGTIN